MRILNLTGVDISKDFPRAEIFSEDGQGPYQVIVSRDFLSQHEMFGCADALKELVGKLAPGGTLHLAEPSAEWAAQEIKAGRINIPLMMHIYGSPDRPRRNICTLEEIRDLLLVVGLMPERAITRPYVVAKDHLGNEFKADQHYVVYSKPVYGEAKAWTAD